eukprot:c20713_g1_i5.p1 GENE.c20713_g1_i5~~c20713_g1_i5.p1  ORF type:complete len:201 (+),score=57.70 c20713_g1_i5:1350-1952(+)
MGPRAAQRLAELEIHTIGDLALKFEATTKGAEQLAALLYTPRTSLKAPVMLKVLQTVHKEILSGSSPTTHLYSSPTIGSSGASSPRTSPVTIATTPLFKTAQSPPTNTSLSLSCQHQRVQQPQQASYASPVVFEVPAEEYPMDLIAESAEVETSTFSNTPETELGSPESLVTPSDNCEFNLSFPSSDPFEGLEPLVDLDK